jgi:hypothetical protein
MFISLIVQVTIGLQGGDLFFPIQEALGTWPLALVLFCQEPLPMAIGN